MAKLGDGSPARPHKLALRSCGRVRGSSPAPFGSLSISNPLPGPSGLRSRDQQELHPALVAEVEVEAVVARVIADQVAAVDGPAEHLEAIVGGRPDLDVIEDRAPTDTREGQAVELVVGRQLHARISIRT